MKQIMAQNPQRIFGDIVNQTTKRDRETFEQWYLQTYQQKFSWEALFVRKEAKKFGLKYKIKKNIKYNECLGTQKVNYLILMIIY